jgi:hypothetical protein
MLLTDQFGHSRQRDGNICGPNLCALWSDGKACPQSLFSGRPKGLHLILRFGKLERTTAVRLGDLLCQVNAVFNCILGA